MPRRIEYKLWTIDGETKEKNKSMQSLCQCVGSFCDVFNFVFIGPKV